MAATVFDSPSVDKPCVVKGGLPETRDCQVSICEATLGQANTRELQSADFGAAAATSHAVSTSSGQGNQSRSWLSEAANQGELSTPQLAPDSLPGVAIRDTFASLLKSSETAPLSEASPCVPSCAHGVSDDSEGPNKSVDSSSEPHSSQSPAGRQKGASVDELEPVCSIGSLQVNLPLSEQSQVFAPQRAVADQVASREWTDPVGSAAENPLLHLPLSRPAFDSAVVKRAMVSRFTRCRHLAVEVTRLPRQSQSPKESLELCNQFPDQRGRMSRKQENGSPYQWINQSSSYDFDKAEKSVPIDISSYSRMKGDSLSASVRNDDSTSPFCNPPLTLSGLPQARGLTRSVFEESNLYFMQADEHKFLVPSRGEELGLKEPPMGNAGRNGFPVDRLSPTLSEPCQSMFRCTEDSDAAAAQSLVRERRQRSTDHQRPGDAHCHFQSKPIFGSAEAPASGLLKNSVLPSESVPFLQWRQGEGLSPETNNHKTASQQDLAGCEEDLLQFVLQLTDTPPADRSPSGSHCCEEAEAECRQVCEVGPGCSFSGTDAVSVGQGQPANEPEPGHLCSQPSQSCSSSSVRAGASISGYPRASRGLPRGRSLQQLVSLPSLVTNTEATGRDPLREKLTGDKATKNASVGPRLSLLLASAFAKQDNNRHPRAKVIPVKSLAGETPKSRVARSDSTLADGTCALSIDGMSKSTTDGTCKSVNSLLSALSFSGSLTNVSTPSRFPSTPTWTTPPDIATPTAPSRRSSMNGLFQRLDSFAEEPTANGLENDGGSENELLKSHVRRDQNSAGIGESILAESVDGKEVQASEQALIARAREDCLSREALRLFHQRKLNLSPLAEISGSSYSGGRTDSLQGTPISMFLQSPSHPTYLAKTSRYLDHSQCTDSLTNDKLDASIQNEAHPGRLNNQGHAADLGGLDCRHLEEQYHRIIPQVSDPDDAMANNEQTMARGYLSMITPSSDIVNESTDAYPETLSCIPSPPYHRHLSFDSSCNTDGSVTGLEAPFQLFASPPTQQLFDQPYNRHSPYEFLSEPTQWRSRIGSAPSLDERPNAFPNNDGMLFDSRESAFNGRKASLDSRQNYRYPEQARQFSPPSVTNHWSLQPVSTLALSPDIRSYPEELGQNPQPAEPASVRRRLPPVPKALDFYPLSSGVNCANTQRRWQNLNVVFPLFVPHGTVAILRPNGENTYVFSDAHPSSQLLFSAAGKVCDTWATYLRLRVAVIHKCPEFLVARVAQLFNQCLSEIPKFSSPITLNCTGMVKHTIQLRASGSVTYRYDTIGSLATAEDQEKMRTLFEALKKVKADVNHYLARELDSGAKPAKEFRGVQIKGAEVDPLGDIGTANNPLPRSSKSGLEFRFSPCRELKIAIREGTLCECDGIDSMIAGGGASSMSTWASQFVVENLIVGEIRLERDKTTEVQLDPFYFPEHEITTRFITPDLQGQPARVCFVDQSIYPQLYRPSVEYCMGLTALQAARALCGATHQILAEALPNGFRSLMGKGCADALQSIHQASAGCAVNERHSYKDRQEGGVGAVESCLTQTTTASDDKDSAPWTNFLADSASAGPSSYRRNLCSELSAMFQLSSCGDQTAHHDEVPHDPPERCRSMAQGAAQSIDPATTHSWQTSPSLVETTSPPSWGLLATERCPHNLFSGRISECVGNADRHPAGGRSFAEWPALDEDLELQGTQSLSRGLFSQQTVQPCGVSSPKSLNDCRSKE